MGTSVEVVPDCPVRKDRDDAIFIIGQARHIKLLSYSTIKLKLIPRVSEEVWNKSINGLQPNPIDVVSLFLDKILILALPDRVSRHNTNAASYHIDKLINRYSGRHSFENIILVAERGDVLASVCAIGRNFPLFSMKTSSSGKVEKEIKIEVKLTSDQTLTTSEYQLLNDAISSIRLSARIVDTPTNFMNTDNFLHEIQAVANELKVVKLTVIRGEELRDRGFGGIWGVGKAAVAGPALAILSHEPAGATQNIAWVGKGIVYDTGGLSMKTKDTMPGMKKDCGGAAGILGGFRLAVKSGFKENLFAIFCLAENAVGPSATRPDDIHVMYSGKSVEINNTDAEGRLVLADGVAYAAKDLGCHIILDMATLTGAQGIATGRYHAAVVANCTELERMSVVAGRISGDLTHPLPYAPELHFQEFTSAVADMKNSVADRKNGQSSCAALFIASHIGFDTKIRWIHVDMASPVSQGERATGYGPALLAVMFGTHSENSLLNDISPSFQS